MKSSRKSLLPRFEHDERQAFYNAQVLLRAEENNCDELIESSSEFKEDIEQHLAIEKELLPNSEDIKWIPNTKYTNNEIHHFKHWMTSEN